MLGPRSGAHSPSLADGFLHVLFSIVGAAMPGAMWKAREHVRAMTVMVQQLALAGFVPSIQAPASESYSGAWHRSGFPKTS